ncbi:hypothetical protein AB0331_13610 [Dietzia maris]|uniref:hypothetical protein n=1 Tax=Dietzia maris TaxID=37915 RepID=UPI00344B3343
MSNARREPGLDREKAAKLAEMVTAVVGLDGDRLHAFQDACEATRPARSAAAAVLSDAIAVTEDWTLHEVSARFPRSMQALNEVTRGDSAAHLQTEQQTALSDAMVAVIWRECADRLGDRLVATLTSPFRGIGLSA